MGVKYFYYGILIIFYVVIDFGGDNKLSVVVRRIDLLKFIEGWLDFVKIVYLVGKCFLLKKVIEVVENLVVNLDNWKRYNIFRNNCEYFVIFCKIGKVFCV